MNESILKETVAETVVKMNKLLSAETALNNAKIHAKAGIRSASYSRLRVMTNVVLSNSEFLEYAIKNGIITLNIPKLEKLLKNLEKSLNEMKGV